jgi:chromosome segregation ATPase
MVNTDVSNVLIGLAAIEAKQASLSAQMLEAGAREDERFRTLQRLVDERHQALLIRLEERQRGRDRFEDSVLDAVSEIRDAIKPLEGRITELESVKKQFITAGSVLGGATVTLAGIVAWLVEHVPAWLAPVFVVAVASACQ